MNNNINIVVLMTILVVLALAGCTTTRKVLVLNDTVNIEKISSSKADIVNVRVNRQDNHVVLRGQVVRRLPGRGHISGHVEVEVIDADGAVIEQSGINYHQQSFKSKYANFQTTFKKAPPAGSTIRVAHDIDTP